MQAVSAGHFITQEPGHALNMLTGKIKTHERSIAWTCGQKHMKESVVGYMKNGSTQPVCMYLSVV